VKPVPPPPGDISATIPVLTRTCTELGYNQLIVTPLAVRICVVGTAAGEAFLASHFAAKRPQFSALALDDHYSRPTLRRPAFVPAAAASAVCTRQGEGTVQPPRVGRCSS
jgi:hypothetical protein